MSLNRALKSSYSIRTQQHVHRFHPRLFLLIVVVGSVTLLISVLETATASHALKQEWDADPQSGGIQQAEQDFLGLDVAVNDTGIYHTGFNDTCPVIISDNGSQLTEGPFLCSIYKNAYDGEWNIQEEFRAKAANPYWQ